MMAASFVALVEVCSIPLRAYEHIFLCNFNIIAYFGTMFSVFDSPLVPSLLYLDMQVQLRSHHLFLVAVSVGRYIQS